MAENSGQGWYSVTLAFSESESKGKPLEDSFKRLFEEKGSPKETALFQTTDRQLRLVTYYFSPAAMAFSGELIAQRGEPCVAPSPPLEGLTWIFGDRSGSLQPYRTLYPTLPDEL